MGVQTLQVSKQMNLDKQKHTGKKLYGLV